MKKLLLLLFVFAAFSTSAHAALIQFKLTVASNSSLGTVMVFNKTTNTPGVVCNGTTPCTFTFKTGTKITITGNPQVANAAGFVGWGPVTGNAIGVCGTANQCSFTLTQDTKATAKILPLFILRVQVGTGSGTIRVKRNGVLFVDCTNSAPLSCSGGALLDTVVTIENIAGPNQKFAGYINKTGSAQACTGATCSFVMKAESSLVSNFIQTP